MLVVDDPVRASVRAVTAFAGGWIQWGRHLEEVELVDGLLTTCCGFTELHEAVGRYLRVRKAQSRLIVRCDRLNRPHGAFGEKASGSETSELSAIGQICIFGMELL